MRIERHVFGSKTGYTTLARSRGVGDAERRGLETFAFGQTNDRQYIQSLAQTAAYISRPLGDDCRAVTRVLPGPPDDQGRATLLFLSAVVRTRDWVEALRGDVLPLLTERELWQWDGQATLDPLDLHLSAPAVDALDPTLAREVLEIISELERCDAADKNLVIGEPQFNSTTVRVVEMLLPDDVKASFSAAARSLSANLDVRLNCLAEGMGVRAAREGLRVFRRDPTAARSPYAAELVSGGLPAGKIPWDVVKSYRGFGLSVYADAQPADAAPIRQLAAAVSAGGGRAAARRKRRLTPAAKIALALGLLALLAAAVLAYGLHRKAAARRARPPSTRDAAVLRPVTRASRPCIGRPAASPVPCGRTAETAVSRATPRPALIVTRRIAHATDTL